MNLNPLTAIGPIDGRYAEQTRLLAGYFSEAALIRYRVKVEIEYFISLSSSLPELESISRNDIEKLRQISSNFGDTDAQEVKNIEKTTNHDVKAVEYFIKSRMNFIGLPELKEFIHFGLTSQDVNNIAIPLSLKDFIEEHYKKHLNNLLLKLDEKIKNWISIPMLARTHGQPASPTRLGKELEVFSVRIKKQLELLKTIPYSAKFGGATGNFNAHVAAYPEVDWKKFADEFVLGWDFPVVSPLLKLNITITWLLYLII